MQYSSVLNEKLCKKCFWFLLFLTCTKAKRSLAKFPEVSPATSLSSSFLNTVGNILLNRFCLCLYQHCSLCGFTLQDQYSIKTFRLRLKKYSFGVKHVYHCTDAQKQRCLWTFVSLYFSKANVATGCNLRSL